jgi:hypothetical protein
MCATGDGRLKACAFPHANTAAWLLAVAWNLRTGIAHGHSLREEAPIQLLISILPVAAAWWLAQLRCR